MAKKHQVEFREQAPRYSSPALVGAVFYDVYVDGQAIGNVLKIPALGPATFSFDRGGTAIGFTLEKLPLVVAAMPRIQALMRQLDEQAAT